MRCPLALDKRRALPRKDLRRALMCLGYLQVVSLLEAGHSTTAQQRLFDDFAPTALHEGRVSDLLDVVHMCQPTLTAPVATLAVRSLVSQDLVVAPRQVQVQGRNVVYALAPVVPEHACVMAALSRGCVHTRTTPRSSAGMSAYVK